MTSAGFEPKDGSRENGLRSLYQALREEDAQRAPGFAQVTRAQSLRALPPHAQVGTLRALMITAALVAVVVLAGVNALRRQPAAQQQPSAPVPMVQVAPAVVPVTPQVAKSVTPAPVQHRRKAAASKVPQAPKIEDWVSPTDAWLTTPGHQLRSTVPSLHFNAVSLND
jgi:hypothetical protein